MKIITMINPATIAYKKTANIEWNCTRGGAGATIYLKDMEIDITVRPKDKEWGIVWKDPREAQQRDAQVITQITNAVMVIDFDDKNDKEQQ